MGMREQPSLLRRGAAPPDERTSAIFIAASCLFHAALLTFFVMKARPTREIALPASAGGPRTHTQLVRITPLRTFPAPDAATVAEPAASRPKPALIKRYTPGVKVVVRTERGPAKKGASDEAKSQPREVAPAPQADLTPRWFSSDSTRIT
ncbi:MAG: hypothetical protein ACRENN_06165, partial [Candidatus Eiseniibacteriota bacterium]